MDWLSLIVGFVKLANWIAGFVHDSQMKEAGKNEAFVEAMTALVARTKISDQITDAIEAMPDSDLDEELKK